MVRFGHPADHTGGAASAPADPGITTITLRDALTDPRCRDPELLERNQLFLVTVGHGTYEVDFRAYQCRPGSLIWAYPGQVVRRGGQPGLDAILVTWPTHLLDGLGPASAPAGPGCWQLTGEDEDAVINEVSQLVVDCGRHPWGERGADLLRHQLAVLLHRLALLPAGGRAALSGARAGPGPTGTTAPGTAGAAAPGPAGAAVLGPIGATALGTAGATAVPGNTAYQRLRQEIERSYRHTRRVEDYATRLRCSVRTLTRACLAATGRSAKQVIDDRVTLQAMRLLAATESPIAEIAGQLGFSEPTNFGRFFQREVGQSPGAFRSRLRSGRPA